MSGPTGPATGGPPRRVGSDTGGTFTDLVADDGNIVKVPSTPHDPGEAVRSGLTALGVARPGVLTHGTTVATNALLERRGATVTLVTTEGFADVVEIARQDRPSLYDPGIVRPAPLVDRAHRVEAAGRLAADGSELEPVRPPSPDDLPPDTEAVAVCLLHSDLDPAHERTVAHALAAAGHDVTVSADVSPEYREYERTVTTVVNAYLRPVCRSYVERLADAADEVFVMTSAGGLVPAADAASVPAALLLSGPAGGVRAGAAMAVANGCPDAVTFDMGGTSTDVCLVLDGSPEPAAERRVGGLPVRLPSLDVHTIGAGGGSIAAIDSGGALRVGPRSAGAVPGPVCYGRGGDRPTVTDADLVCGRIGPDTAFPGLGTLDVDAARSAFESAGVDPDGVIAVVDAAMTQALRVVSVQRGVDPRSLALVAFGGAGPLHACALATELGIPRVIVPARAGVLSALGILTAPVQRTLVRSWPDPDDHDVDAAVAQLADRALSMVGGEATVSVAVDCRYRGQSHELSVPTVGAFHHEHERRNGYARPDTPVEIVALRVTATRPAPLDVGDLPAPDRQGGRGPRVIAEADCTIWVPAGWEARPGAAGALVLEPTS